MPSGGCGWLWGGGLFRGSLLAAAGSAPRRPPLKRALFPTRGCEVAKRRGFVASFPLQGEPGNGEGNFLSTQNRKREAGSGATMAQFQQQLCWLVVAGLAVTLRACQAEVSIVFRSDSEGVVLEGSNVTLECLGDEGEEMSGFTFQKYSKWLHSWISLDKASETRCWFYDVSVSYDDGHPQLTIRGLKSWHTGPYRCIGSNVTGNASVSNELDLQMEYLHSILLARTNTWCGTVGSSITVLEGSDLHLRCSAGASQPPLYEWTREDADWVLISSDLTLSKVNREQAGTYTCQAQHPTLPQLTKRKSIHLYVEGSERGFTLESVLSLSTPMLALAVALPAVLLLLLITVFAFLIPRHRAAAKKKAAQEDFGQRTPIYKGSLESVPSTVGDTHPLVM